MTVRNDATRVSIPTREKRRPRAVVARQGQVLLDTDFDQQSRHLLERMEMETGDTLGVRNRVAVPAGSTGFLVSPAGAAASFDIGAGHGYLDGWLLENPAVCTLATQPHPRSGDAVAASAAVGLKALIRYLDQAEEPGLADIALGDAQSSGRSLIDWQVFPLGATGPLADCTAAAALSDWVNLSAPSTGTLAVIPDVAAPQLDPCSLTPGGGYTRLENLLYRIEVHGGVARADYPSIDGPRFGLAGLKLKLSRRNASLMARVVAINGTEIMVDPPALDPRTWFAAGQYAEIVSVHDDIDPRAAIAHERLFQVASVRDDRITLQAAAVDIAATGIAADATWFLRMWEAFPGGSGTATATVNGGSATSASIDLGDGLSIKLGAGAAATFRRGDFWNVAVRADGTVDWPEAAGVRLLVKPHGPETRYAPIAVLNPPPGAPAAPAMLDCRTPVATLSDRSLHYRGGDGQSVFPGAAIGLRKVPGTLRVGVLRGRTPVPNARIRWTPTPQSQSGTIDGQPCSTAASVITTTDQNGLSEVVWAIRNNRPDTPQQVEATLLTETGTEVPPIVFTAVFNLASTVGYAPQQDCAPLAGIDNVQDALDKLCASLGPPPAAEPKTLMLHSIILEGNNGKTDLIKEELILNGLEVAYDAFAEGIEIGLERRLDFAFEPFDPVLEVFLDLPYPLADREYWQGLRAPFGFNRIRLDGTIQDMERGSSGDPGLLWNPSKAARRIIETAQDHQWGYKSWEMREQRLLCTMRLRSALIFVRDEETGGNIYLNAEHLGVRANVTNRELWLKDRDPQRAADLDMFFYLTGWAG